VEGLLHPAAPDKICPDHHAAYKQVFAPVNPGKILFTPFRIYIGKKTESAEIDPDDRFFRELDFMRNGKECPVTTYGHERVAVPNQRGFCGSYGGEGRNLRLEHGVELNGYSGFGGPAVDLFENRADLSGLLEREYAE
jgi:hypothetical protein